MPKFEALIKDNFSLVILCDKPFVNTEAFVESVHQLDGKCSVYKLQKSENETFFEYMLVTNYPTFLLYKKGVQIMRFQEESVLKEVIELIENEL